jgi:hypothetical protein
MVMSTNVVVKDGQPLARPLRVLVPLIKEDLQHGREAAERAGMPYYQAAGEKFIEAKSQMKHGEFEPWVKRNFGISRKTASLYMGLVRHLESFPGETFTSQREFRREVLGETRHETREETWHKPIKQIVSRVDIETLNLKREELKRQDERDAQRQLALQLIDIGYKVLARSLHPDKGGSREAMSRLNTVRERLKQAA